MEPRVSQFREDLQQARNICVDTMILIYHLEDLVPYSTLTSALFELLANSRVSAVVSAVTVTEILAKPYSLADPHKVQQVEEFLGTMPSTTMVPVDYAVASKAAELRGKLGLQTPEALIFATTVASGANVLVSNSPSLSGLTVDQARVLHLGHYLTP